MAAILSIGSTTGGAIVDTVNQDQPDPPPRTCTVAVDETLDLVKEHPEFGEDYAKRGRSSHTRLATDEEIRRCGDMEKMVEQLAANGRLSFSRRGATRP